MNPLEIRICRNFPKIPPTFIESYGENIFEIKVNHYSLNKVFSVKICYRKENSHVMLVVKNRMKKLAIIFFFLFFLARTRVHNFCCLQKMFPCVKHLSVKSHYVHKSINLKLRIDSQLDKKNSMEINMTNIKRRWDHFILWCNL